MRHPRIPIMSNDYVNVKRRPLMECLTCSLCSNLYREATTISVCLHTFCKQCIYQKFDDNVQNCCPVCKTYLGSFPKTLLRPDYNLRELVTQMLPSGNSASREGRSLSLFPLGNSSSRERRSLSFPTNITNHENSGSNAPGANGLPNYYFGMTQIFPDDRGKAANNEHPNITPFKSSNNLSTAFEKQPTWLQMAPPQVAPVISESMFRLQSLNKANNGPSQLDRLGCHEEAENKTDETHEAEQNSLMKIKRKRKIKRSSFFVQKNGDGNSGSSKEISILSSDGAQRSIDGSSRPVWFCLLACEEKNGTALPQIPKPYIRTNDGDLAVSFVNKYLVQKLNLKHESEVEIMCCGHTLIPTLTLKNLIDIWVQSTSDMGLMCMDFNEGKADGKDFVMELTYRRSKRQRTLL